MRGAASRAYTGLAACLIVVCTTALAQTAAPPATPSKDVIARTKAAAAAASSASKKGVDPQNKDFMTEQGRRAMQIREGVEQHPDDAAFFEQKERVDAQKKAQAAWVQAQQKRVLSIAEEAQDNAGEWAGQDNASQPMKRPQYIVFVSQSMGDAGLKAAFAFGKGNPDVGYAFRGFLPGQSPMQFQGAMSQYAGRDEESMVTIMLDPPSFIKYGITSVPAIVQVDENEDLVAKVSGLLNPEWLGEQVKDGKKGDLGNRGETYAIAEPNLIDQMKAKAASIDFTDQISEAKKRFFQQIETIPLPKATEQRVRHIMPVLTVNHDVVDSHGITRYHQGQQLSMQEHLAATPLMVVFNSQDPEQVAFAKQMIARTPETKKIVLMTTEVDRDGGIAAYVRQETAIGRPVYLLMADIKNTFGVEKVPTVITPTDKDFVVVEVPLAQGVSGHGHVGH